MRNASVAEWLLRQFTDRGRAASIVGDLLETADQHNFVWFWLSVAGIVLSLVWRRPVAFVAAFYVGLYSVGFLQVPIYGVHNTSQIHRIPHVWIPVFGVMSGLGMVLWIAAPYTAIRYGIRDSFVQLVLALCTLVTATICYWWIPNVLITCIIVGVSIVIGFLLFAPRRRALLAVASTLVIGLGGGLTTFYLAARYEAYVDSHSGGLINQVPVGLLSVLAVTIVTTACSRTHDFLLHDD